MKIHLTSDEINLLVYRYLIENGFVHTAFSFNSEANVPKNPFFTTQMERVPPNALVGFLQKALLYIYLEYHTSDETGEEIRCEEPFSIFKRHECWCRPLEQIGSSLESVDTQGNGSNLESARGAEEAMRIDSSLGSKDTSALEQSMVDASVQPPAKKTRKSRSIGSSMDPEAFVHADAQEQQLVDGSCGASKDGQESLRDYAAEVGSAGPGPDRESGVGPSVKGEESDSIEVKEVKSESCPERMADEGRPETDKDGRSGGYCEGGDLGAGNKDSEVSGHAEDVTKTESVALPPADRYLSDMPHFKLFRKGNSSNGIREVQFSKRRESPNKLVITWEEGCPELWEIDPSSQERNLESSILLPVSEGDSMIAGTVVTMSNDYIVIGYENGSVTLFSYVGKELATVRGSQDHESPVVSLRLSEQNEYLAVGDAAGSVKILRISFEESSGSYTTQLVNSHHHNSAIFGLCWCKNDSFLLSGCLDRQITVLDLKSSLVKSFGQDGPILSINQLGQEGSLVTCVLEGVSTIPVLRISKDEDVRLDCIARISMDEECVGPRDDPSSAAPPPINFVESNLVGDKLLHIVATPFSVYLFDEHCKLVSSQSITSTEPGSSEIVSICVDNKSNSILAGLNDGSVVLLELSTLEIKSRLLENRSSGKQMLSTGVGKVSMNSSGNLIFVGGPDLPAIYIFDY
ncbi:LisH domain-containing protein [Cryptosporidium canis]|uniref:LisH domain-containing protein n=1 Tax=Cryptosporidium canis TaxID=195482 RepID=A0ABQ8P994_9CRYT|nr:LisH domain-containing protein [Cryptosporidium canis]